MRPSTPTTSMAQMQPRYQMGHARSMVISEPRGGIAWAPWGSPSLSTVALAAICCCAAASFLQINCDSV